MTARRTTDPDRASRPRGFTLIELLVVVAIISLLVAVLLPSLQGAREAARIATCLSNERGLTTAVHQYAEIYNGYVPAWVLTASSSHQSTWYWLTYEGLIEKLPLALYSKPSNRFCPSINAEPTPTHSINGGAGAQSRLAHYAMHLSVIGYHRLENDVVQAPVRNLDRIRNPGRVMALVDAEWWDGAEKNSVASSSVQNPAFRFGAIYDIGYGQDGTTRYPTEDYVRGYRHGLRVNFSFLDGHAETIEVDYNDPSYWGPVQYGDWND